jgi:AAA domain-containing protein
MSTPDDHSLVLPPLRWGLAGLHSEAAPKLRWLWHGYLAVGSVTLLTSQWKIGKTTLLSILLARMKAGGTLAGLPVSAGRAVVISEESSEQWLQRGRRLDLDNHIGWYCRPFRGRPSPQQWQGLLDCVADAAAQRDLSLVVIDPLASFFPGKSENDATAMLDALAPVQRLAAHGLSVLILHHPSKKDNGDGPSGRGSGALLGCADILIEMRWYRHPTDTDRRRRLLALSRFDDTPREMVIELNADGTDYVSRGSFASEEFAAHWRLLEGLLRQADRKLSRDEILAGWLAEDRPDAVTLYRWLRRAVEHGLLRQDGLGKSKNPFRYWLPESEERWRRDPIALIRMPELFQPPRR